MSNTSNTRRDPKAIALVLVIVGATFLAGMFVSKAPTGVAVLAIVGVLIAVVSFVYSEVALYVLIVSMLLSPEFMAGGLTGDTTASRGVTLRFDDILLVIIGFTWFCKAAIRKDLGLFLKTPLNPPIAYYFVVCLISTLAGYIMGRVNGLTGFFFVLKYFEYFIVFFMAVNHLRDRKQIERFVIAMLIVCSIVAMIAILQIPAGGRVTAPFEGDEGEPNTLGGYLVLMLAIVLGLLVTARTMRQRAMLGVLAVLITVPLLATLSRSSWLAVIPMLFTLLYFSKKRMVIVLPLVSVALIVPFMLPNAVKERALFTFTQPTERGQMEIGGLRVDTSTSARLSSWKDVLTRDFIKHPVIGHGVTGYRFLDAQYPRVLAETGLLGFAFFVWLLVAICRSALASFRTTSDPLFGGLSLGYLAGFAAMLAHCIGSNTFIIVRIMEPFWFLTAMVIMIPEIEKAEQEGRDVGAVTA